MKNPDLSVIILSFNTQKLLEQCLRSVFSSRLGKYSLEVIVVDNDSSDGSREYLKELRKNFVAKNIRLITIFNRKNLGFAGGNNVGVKKAKGRYLLFLNSDTKVTPDAFREIIEFMDKHPEYGACTVKTMLFSGGMDPDCHRGFPTPWASLCYFLGLEKLFPKSKLFGQYHKFYLDLNRVHEIDAGAGAFLLVRREILEAIGGWDEHYFFYGEDLDLFYRIKQGGWKTVFYPKPLVMHYKGASSGLRKESKKLGVVRADRKTRIKIAWSSVKAMEIFYHKFYRNQYPRWVTFLIISAIKIKGCWRVLKQLLS
ncbi:glycosyltransferase family 2 protein [bacterium]|nr:glycosyltransferase family 2 protein [bacterium]